MPLSFTTHNVEISKDILRGIYMHLLHSVELSSRSFYMLSRARCLGRSHIPVGVYQRKVITHLNLLVSICDSCIYVSVKASVI